VVSQNKKPRQIAGAGLQLMGEVAIVVMRLTGQCFQV